MNFALVFPLQIYSSPFGPVAKLQATGHVLPRTDATAKTVAQIIDSWIKANHWAWEDDESEKPDQIIEGHILSPDSSDLVALFSVSDGGSNTTQYIYVFTRHGDSLEPINVYRVGQKGRAIVDSIRTESYPGYTPSTADGSSNLVIQGRIYSDGSHDSEADPACCPSLIRQWPVRITSSSLTYTSNNSPFLPQGIGQNSTQSSDLKSIKKAHHPPILNSVERQEAERLWAKKVGMPPPKDPQRYYQFQLQANLYFVVERALRSTGFTPGGVDYFYQMVNEKMDTMGLLGAFNFAFQNTKTAIWSRRNWNQEDIARNKMKILDKASNDMRQILTEDFR